MNSNNINSKFDRLFDPLFDSVRNDMKFDYLSDPLNKNNIVSKYLKESVSLNRYLFEENENKSKLIGEHLSKSIKLEDENIFLKQNIKKLKNEIKKLNKKLIASTEYKDVIEISKIEIPNMSKLVTEENLLNSFPYLK